MCVCDTGSHLVLGCERIEGAPTPFVAEAFQGLALTASFEKDLRCLLWPRSFSPGCVTSHLRYPGFKRLEIREASILPETIVHHK